jgi:hypothetical protein
MDNALPLRSRFISDSGSFQDGPGLAIVASLGFYIFLLLSLL